MVNLEYGSSFPGFDLRSGSAPMISLAAGYANLKGRNVGGNRHLSGSPSLQKNYFLEQDFKTTFNALVVTPSLGWSWTKPARASGNEPELLLTRVESVYVKLSAMIPFYSNARVEVTKRSESDELSQAPRRVTSTGQISGYSMSLSSGLWLGI